MKETDCYRTDIDNLGDWVLSDRIYEKAVFISSQSRKGDLPQWDSSNHWVAYMNWRTRCGGDKRYRYRFSWYCFLPLRYSHNRRGNNDKYLLNPKSVLNSYVAEDYPGANCRGNTIITVDNTIFSAEIEVDVDAVPDQQLLCTDLFTRPLI